MGLKRVSVIVCALSVAVLGFASAPRAEVKIGYIDSDQILANYSDFQEAQSKYREYEEELGREINKRQNELEDMQKNFERQALLLSEKRKQEEQASIRKKREELERFVSEATSPNGRLAQKNQELSEPIFGKVNEIIQRVAKASGYDFVLNTAALAYANEAFDLTQKVLEELQKDKEKEQNVGTNR